MKSSENTGFKKCLVRALAIGMMALLLAGCSGGGTSDMTKEEMQEDIKQAFLNWQNADSGKFTLAFEGNLESDAATAEDGTDLPAEKLFLDGSLEGKTVLANEETDKFDFEFTLEGEGSLNDEDLQALNAGIVFSADNLYFRIDEFPTFETGDLASVNAIVALFKNKWWSVPVPAEVYEQNQLTSWLSLPSDSEELTEEQKQLHELYASSDFFKTIDLAGTESVEGVKSTKYEVTLDGEGIFDYAVTYGEISGNPMSVQDQEDLQSALETTDLDLEIYVAVKDKYLSKITADIEVESSDDDRPGRMNISVDFVFGDFNGPVQVEVPEDATLFDIGSFLGGGVPASGGFEFAE
jgi:hypothetical protein